jgi:Uma2 family endonuclease
MATPILSEKRFTVDEYIEFEEKSDIRHEFHEGFLYPISGTSDAHNDIALNVSTALRAAFRKQGCKTYQENLKLEVIENTKFLYPDIMLTCDERDMTSTFIKRYPSLIVEVLSKSTASYDRNGKFDLYQTLPSILYYLMIDSRWQIAELYSRTDKPSLWTFQRFSNLNEIIEFPKLNFTLSLATIYEDLDLPKRLSYIIDDNEP